MAKRLVYVLSALCIFLALGLVGTLVYFVPLATNQKNSSQPEPTAFVITLPTPTLATPTPTPTPTVSPTSPESSPTLTFPPIGESISITSASLKAPTNTIHGWVGVIASSRSGLRVQLSSIIISYSGTNVCTVPINQVVTNYQTNLSCYFTPNSTVPAGYYYTITLVTEAGNKFSISEVFAQQQ
jgi:hypothetical protein